MTTFDDTEQERKHRDEGAAEDAGGGGPGETPADDPSEGPGPRGNQEIDPDRVRKVEEDIDRTGN